MFVQKMNDGMTKFHLNPNDENQWDGFKPVMHKFTDHDKGPPHDHPWSFRTFILKGSYIEHVWYLGEDGKPFYVKYHRKTGDSFVVKATCIHQIVELPEGECWTLIIAYEDMPRREVRFYDYEQGLTSSRAWNE